MVQTLLSELNIHAPRVAKLWCNNVGAKYLSTNSVFHVRTKHIKVDYHFLRDRAARKLLVEYTSIEDQDADGFMKSLIVRQMERFQEQS